jgi:glycosyltransferase involved in cell wall biosynthesis
MKLTKKKILVLTDWYLPAVNAGGPVRSVAAIVSALKNDFEISVLTSDRDFGDSKSFQGIETDVWLNKDGYRLQYVSPDFLSVSIKEESNKAYDKIYLNSLFSKYFTLSVLRAIKSVDKNKVVIAPRGMLGEGALGLKAFKKKTFLRLAKAIGLYNKVTWHASTELETTEIVAVFPKANVVALENLSSCIPEEYVPSSKAQGRLKMVFVSRISIKKNLLFLLQLMTEIGEEKISLDIYGPIEDQDYWDKCLTLLSKNSAVQYKGVVQPDALHSVLKGYDLFVLPTLNENFGHIILEALNSSLPLLLSNNTPWLNLKVGGVGVDISLDDNSEWKKTVLEFLQMPATEYEQIRKSAWEFGQKKLNQQYLKKEYVKLFS